MSKILLVSDTHFGDRSASVRRGFACVEAMDNALIDGWNNVVRSDDVVYHLGDFSMVGGARTIDYIHSLNGRIKLVPGNHDSKHSGVTLAEFDEVLPPLFELKVARHMPDGTADVDRFVLCHFPLVSWNRMHYGAMHLHGHSHGSLKWNGGKMFDVGVDADPTGWHAERPWAPIPLETVLAEMSTRSFVSFDHHAEKATTP